MNKKTLYWIGGTLVAYLIYRKFRYGGSKTPSGTLVKMCSVSTCGKCYCGEGQQPFMKVLSKSGCDYQLEIINDNSGQRPKGDIYTWNDRNCSKPGMEGAGGLVELTEEDKNALVRASYIR